MKEDVLNNDPLPRIPQPMSLHWHLRNSDMALGIVVN